MSDLIPLLPGVIPTPIAPVHPIVYDSTLWSGQVYWILVVLIGAYIFVLMMFHLIISIWGSPILKASKAHTSGRAIVQHCENSRIATLKLASIGGGAIRHVKVDDGTLITIPKGINNLEGISLINSWNLTGISLPIFLMGGITKLRQLGINTRDLLVKSTSEKFMALDGSYYTKLPLAANLIIEAYNFNDFKDILKKSEEPNLIPLEIEYTHDYIEAVNQHYTESDITKEVKSFFFNNKSDVGKVLIYMAIAVLVVAIAGYFLIGTIK